MCVPSDVGSLEQDRNNNMQQSQYGNQPQVVYVVQQSPPGYYQPQQQPMYGQQQPVYIQQQYGQQQYGGPPQQNPYQNNSDVIAVSYMSNFSDPQVRRDFIRRVYTILCGQLLFFFGIICLGSFYQPAKDWLLENALYILIPCVVIYFGLMCVSCCAPQMFTQSPANWVVLVLLTISLTGILVFSAMKYKPKIVALSIGVTMGVFILLTIFAFSCNYDFTKCFMVMFVVTLAFTLFGFLAAILVPTDQFKIVDLVFACIGALIFSVWIVIDTQMLMEGKQQSLDTDMEVFAAIQLFLDVVLLFVYLMQILGYVGSDE